MYRPRRSSRRLKFMGTDGRRRKLERRKWRGALRGVAGKRALIFKSMILLKKERIYDEKKITIEARAQSSALRAHASARSGSRYRI